MIENAHWESSSSQKLEQRRRAQPGAVLLAFTSWKGANRSLDTISEARREVIYEVLIASLDVTPGIFFSIFTIWRISGLYF